MVSVGENADCVRSGGCYSSTSRVNLKMKQYDPKAYRINVSIIYKIDVTLRSVWIGRHSVFFNKLN